MFIITYPVSLGPSHTDVQEMYIWSTSGQLYEYCTQIPRSCSDLDVDWVYFLSLCHNVSDYS